ncbi:hypothetical protein AMES_1100 [Amycolatopsis mediterranei S699]|uniref:Uncharacterized protein n=2 Tax=Amycolatopsis mediterranei TaxID=33910 RepID=A0A0H3CWA6_AMYMU|nr:hypothetical protein [Amycolatopsis mediterranei]ADJ42922.1 hypothetical protein AMED_1106 [Amycolatopsis mediterranei U32]AEK39616.1 hypothetical protein RAM_05620 [Amycolatopsis mediterranei S699]AFO74636.1 hypothetical protein AMES_1100 [Amycolatopsis mediterranei S699]AGT81765.1 hypothetical protein B737_1101 [Amycolatopsis mediterranei RB]KDO04410.1 hypothetical protein DV26_44435 [Amycolatopsis mediterranei]
MASPDTDELATVPLPAGQPEAAQVPARRAAPEAREVGAPRQERTEAAPHEAGAAQSGELREAAAAQPEALGAAGEPNVEQERVAPERIEPGDTAPDIEASAPTEPAKERGRWWRGFTGSLAAGLTVLAIGVLVVAGVCLFTGAPGPGATLLVGHPVAAALALLAQRVADRRNGPPAAGAGVAVVLFTVSALTLFWLT